VVLVVVLLTMYACTRTTPAGGGTSLPLPTSASAPVPPQTYPPPTYPPPTTPEPTTPEPTSSEPTSSERLTPPTRVEAGSGGQAAEQASNRGYGIGFLGISLALAALGIALLLRARRTP
jgi:hypothetical protein